MTLKGSTYVCVVAIRLRSGLVGLPHGENACLRRREEVVQIREGLCGTSAESTAAEMNVPVPLKMSSCGRERWYATTQLEAE